MKISTFLAYNAGLLLALIGAYILVIQNTEVEENPVIPWIFVGFAALNLFFIRMLKKANQRSPQRFITAFLGVVGIKLMSAMVFLLIYLMIVKDAPVIPVTGALFIAYMSFTILLIRAVLKKTEENS